MVPTEVCCLGLWKLVTTIAVASSSCDTGSVNAHGEPIPEEYKQFYEKAMDHHYPDLDHKRVKMATDGSVKGYSGGAAAFLQDQNGWLVRLQIPVDADGSKLTLYKK